MISIDHIYLHERIVTKYVTYPIYTCRRSDREKKPILFDDLAIFVNNIDPAKLPKEYSSYQCAEKIDGGHF